ncbi:MAG: [citrate (pro-3S)-lyase] ligase [Candidatus Izemoplasmataceae bacterium]
MELKDVVLEEEKAELRQFLKAFHLVYEQDIDLSLTLREEGKIIATASAAKNIVKCVAIDESYQGKSLANTLMSALIKRLNQRGHHHLFLYSRPELMPYFKPLGFKRIVESMNFAFMELGGDITRTLKKLKQAHELSSKPKGCVVVNANPLTNGHLYLIKEAKKHHDRLLVFVVSEDRSFFPFAARFKIIEEALEGMEGITVLPTQDYLVSYATFPKYFLKHESSIKEEHALLDVLVFKEYYMKIFNITDRYVGDEPYSPMTNTYNRTMKKYLNSDLHILERKAIDDTPISASTVRKLLQNHSLEAIEPYVPEATLRFLRSEQGQAIIEAMKTHASRH